MSNVELGQRLEDDLLYTPTIKPHSLEKIRLHNYYAALFSTSMRKQWPQRAYIGLYSGAGRARVEDTGEIVETSALSALRLKHPFTKYIFVDRDPRCVDALESRIANLPQTYDVSIINRDVKDAVPDILSTMPRFGPGNGLLSFCFIDPFSAALDFRIIKDLSRYKMDFLVLLMLGRDVRTNFKRYFEDPSDVRIAALVDDPDWRDQWKAQGQSSRYLIHFLLSKFDAAMTRIGYISSIDDAHPVRIEDKGVYQYSLVFYTKNPLGQKFWKESRHGISQQLEIWS